MGFTENVLSQDSFFMINKKILLEYGINVALMLTALSEGEKLTSDGEEWFYQTTPMMEKFTGLKRGKQEKALKKMIELGWVEQKNFGLPMKRHFKINEKAIIAFLSQ
jgi:hypothetical protein